MEATLPVTVERRGHVAVVWLDRPDQRNAFAPEFWTLFPNVIEEVGEDAEIRAIVVAANSLISSEWRNKMTRAWIVEMSASPSSFNPARLSGCAILIASLN